ncbi:hypothetical protein NC652_022322 [Populus alba x Populus x berolinensis]|nr:hypothetical protein NC652_022322 [Populus alba x Populus x berolinensis]
MSSFPIAPSWVKGSYMSLFPDTAGLVLLWDIQLHLVRMAPLNESPAFQKATLIIHLLLLCLLLSINISLGPVLLVFPRFHLRPSYLNLPYLGDNLPRGVNGIRLSQLIPCLLLYFQVRLLMVFQLLGTSSITAMLPLIHIKTSVNRGALMSRPQLGLLRPPSFWCSFIFLLLSGICFTLLGYMFSRLYNAFLAFVFQTASRWAVCFGLVHICCSIAE